MNPLRVVLTLVAIAAAFGGGWYAGQHKGGAAASSSASASAPAGNEAQMLQTFGWIVGQRAGLKQFGFTPAEVDQMAEGLKLSITSGPRDIPGGEEILPKFQQYMRDRGEKVEKELMAKQDAEAKTFFAGLDKNPAIKKTNSGLYYEIVEPGSGEKPKATDVVTVKYKGTFIDGKVFDETAAGQPPLTIPLNQVVPGWTEGLQLVGKGGKMKLYIPGNLAYGQMSPDPSIPPNATLIFETELVDFSPPSESANSGIQGMTQEQMMQMIQAQMQQQGGGPPPPASGLPPGMSPPPTVSSPPVAAPTP